MSVGSPAGSAANVPDEELEMVVAGSMINKAVGAEVVSPSADRRWRGVYARPAAQWTATSPSSDGDSKGKRVASPNSAGSPSFKKIKHKKEKHVVFDEGPSSSKKACRTEDAGDSDPFLP
ncbi:hypothetical protein Tco_0224191, partial [Tanacetum coccineum]